jgi:glycerate 2-kinase
MQAANLEQHLQGADLVFTGEGRLDHQTLSGKVIAGVCKKAAKYNIPVIAICGERLLSGNELKQLGLQH